MTDVHWSRAAVLRLAIASLVLIGALFLFVFPTTALLHQRGQLREAQERLSVLKEQSTRLEQQTKRAESDSEIERLARDRFNMVKPGEQAWAVVPAPLPTTTTTVTTPPSLPTAP
jgi:cell division protein FtsB